MLKDKVAIITGSARGIGKAIAEKFAKEGSAVIITDVLVDLGQQTSQQLKNEYKVETLFFKLDVTNFAECEEVIKNTLAKFGKIDILVNNAGITKDNLILRMTDSEWDAVLNVNLKGAFNCTKAVIRTMAKQRSGKIINICSIVGLTGNPGQANYSASKGGLIAFTKTVAREFASRNILANAIAPGFIKTQMTEVLPEDIKTKLIGQIPLERLGEPEDVANCALFLASDLSNYITGQVISVNGGMYM